MKKNNSELMAQRADQILKTLKSIVSPFIEIYHGIRSKTLPWDLCFAICAFICLLVVFNADIAILKRFDLAWIYPTKAKWYWTYVSVLLFSVFWIWGLIQKGKQRNLLKQLTETFISAGLKSNMGRLPAFIYDKPTDTYTRKLKVSNARLSLLDFKKAKDKLESGLGVYIDDIKEQRENGTVEITYSHYQMEPVRLYKELKMPNANQFAIGFTRASQVNANLRDVAHLLVAGQTNSGKSTFLRQFITSLYLGNKDYDFTLIDLKGGLEFQLFENLPRVAVISNLSAASNKLRIFNNILEERMAMLKANKCKDIAQFAKVPEKDRKGITNGKIVNLTRHLIVIDEAADIFLAGAHGPTGDVQNARRTLVEIARKGRAVGVHMVVATQRPDAKSVDSNVKANLPGILCFQMPNDASSITVLGNGRATDLPPIPGRAIWKFASEQFEVQTPLLTPEEAEELLKPHRKAEAPTINVQVTEEQSSQPDSSIQIGNPSHPMYDEVKDESANKSAVNGS